MKFKLSVFSKSIVVTTTLVLLVTTAIAQKSIIEAKADSAYTVKNYQLAIQYYSEAISKQRFVFQKKNSYYNIACCYALAGNKDSAWKYLNNSVEAGYNNYAHILEDKDLATLQRDKKWKKLKSLNKRYQSRLHDPSKAELVTTDIHNFWNAYDMVQKDTAHEKKIFTEYYFDKASPGLQDYFVSRISNVDWFVGNQKVKREFYKAIRQNTLMIDNFKPQIQQSFGKLKELYSDAIFPNVYFLIGRWNSAGTVSNNGLLIGTDMLSKSDAVPLGELNLWEKNNYKSIDGLPYIVAHELIHSQQSKMKSDTTTLSNCIREGMADFIGELISGQSSNPRLLEFGKGREKQIWSDFEKDMYLKKAQNWIANAMQETPEHPADLGYWIGYQICKSYYEEMTDKKQAVYDMLHIRDYKMFLTKSRFGEKVAAL
ncbi:MAG TPA: DUF2268 domain-containing putative Zn-dependent protease [Segetibacter sp.]|jgi:hypothetical protein